jgi:tRNA (adenine37-N6)-methyltransferase
MVRIATINTDFPSKFGIPRQSGLIESLSGVITFEKEYANADALRGLEGFSHIWLLWKFSNAIRKGSDSEISGWTPTVRPPRLGGNVRMGVFATRSPFRPNPIGLSCVKLESIELTSPEGPRLIVSGVDIMDGTPIIDIKPYIPYTDCRPEAVGGFTKGIEGSTLNVIIPENLQSVLSATELTTLRKILADDPRPHYQNDPLRVYKFTYSKYEIAFRVDGDELTVISIDRKQ